MLSFTTGVSPYAAEEGLRAFADAAGLAVVRCRTDSEIPADLLDAVGPSALVGADLVVPVEPSAEEGTEKLKVWSAGDYSLFLQYSDAFPGESGSCRMQIQERNAPPNPGGKVAPPLDQEPLRIALERDDLTDGARRWLEEQLGEAGALAIPEE
ncbi:MAG: hypothetical protein H6737_26545 [Alphaproteobacteria bacterium]|nr:hypothetical protein [Alphaproteobacteria bacterium]